MVLGGGLVWSHTGHSRVRLFGVVSLRSPHFSSGLWFFYEASRDTAYLGIVLATILTVAAIIQQAVSRKVAVLMASSTVAAIALLWYAISRYPNPW